MMEHYRGLIALKAVAKTKNFTKAAHTLEVTPPAISQIVKQLESQLGVTLLTRTTRSVSLTEAGENLLRMAGPAIDQIEAALEGISSLADKPSGRLRINMPHLAFYQPVIANKMRSFMAKYPDIELELFFEDQSQEIFEHQFDAGIRISDILAKDTVGLKLFGPIRYVVAGSPGYFKQHGRPKIPKDLLNHNCIRIRFGEASYYDRWEFESRGKDIQVHVKGSLILNDPLLMFQESIAGSGLMYTTEDAIEREVKSGKLEIVLEKYSCSSDGYYLYYPGRSQVMPKLRAFIDHLKEN